MALRTVGLLGGMSWESTALYYRYMNTAVRDRLGGLHSLPVLVWSVDFAEVAALQSAGAWDRAGALLGDAAGRMVAAGAEVLVLATNTMHVVAPAIEAAAGLPLLHIADPTGVALRLLGVSRVGLLGTAFTMEQPFLAERLSSRFGLSVVVPGASDRAEVHRVIFEELCRGQVHPDSRASVSEVIGRLVEDGAEAVILGCTELTMLLGEADSAVPLVDTTQLHALAAVDAAFA